MASSSSSQTVPHKYAISTRLVHADDNSESAITDIAPPLHVSTTYSVTGGPASFTYSRSDHPTRRRVETVLETLCGGPTFCFASGVAAVTAVLYAARPKRLFTMLGYFGSRGAVTSYRAIGRNELADTMFEHVEQLLEQELESGDLVMIESPRNPDALLVDIELVAAHVRRFASARPPPLLAIDNTFATPYIVQPLLLGANFEINSCSKCMTQPRRHRRCWCWHTFSLSLTRALVVVGVDLAGHSDAIMGTVSVRPESRGLAHALNEYRTFAGAVPGSLEVWLLLRSIRTLTLRVDRQTRSAFRARAYRPTRRTLCGPSTTRPMRRLRASRSRRRLLIVCRHTVNCLLTARVSVVSNRTSIGTRLLESTDSLDSTRLDSPACAGPQQALSLGLDGTSRSDSHFDRSRGARRLDR